MSNDESALHQDTRMYRNEPHWHCLDCGSSIVETREIELGPPNPETVKMEFCGNCGGEYDGE